MYEPFLSLCFKETMCFDCKPKSLHVRRKAEKSSEAQADDGESQSPPALTLPSLVQRVLLQKERRKLCERQEVKSTRLSEEFKWCDQCGIQNNKRLVPHINCTSS